MTETTLLSSKTFAWSVGERTLTACWRSEAGLPPPPALQAVDDSLSADAAWRLLAAGQALLWRGDWVNARHLLQALARRAERRINRPGKAPATAAEAFAAHRLRQGERAGLLARLLVEVRGDYRVPLRRAQNVVEPCCEAWGVPDGETS